MPHRLLYHKGSLSYSLSTRLICYIVIRARNLTVCSTLGELLMVTAFAELATSKYQGALVNLLSLVNVMNQ